MNKKSSIVAIIAIIVVGFLLLSWRSAPGSSDASIKPQTAAIALAFGKDAPRYDFGTVSMAQGKIARDFEIVNNSGKEILIRKAMTSCMCTEAVLMLPNGETKGPFGMPGHGIIQQVNARIAAGEKLTTRVVFDPAAHGPAGIGYVERDVMLETDNGEYAFGFSATVAP